jgi:hypothetical protein
MNLPPDVRSFGQRMVNNDAALLNEPSMQGASTHQLNVNNQLATNRGAVINETSQAGNVNALKEAAKIAALRSRDEDHKAATMADYFKATVKQLAGTGQAANDLAWFAHENPNALKPFL